MKWRGGTPPLSSRRNTPMKIISPFIITSGGPTQSLLGAKTPPVIRGTITAGAADHRENQAVGHRDLARTAEAGVRTADISARCRAALRRGRKIAISASSTRSLLCDGHGANPKSSLPRVFHKLPCRPLAPALQRSFRSPSAPMQSQQLGQKPRSDVQSGFIGRRTRSLTLSRARN